MAEEKKDGLFSKLKKKVNDTTLEISLKNTFAKANKEFTVYTGSGFLSMNFNTLIAEDHMDEGYILAWGEQGIDIENAVLYCGEDKVYYVDSVLKAEISISYEGTEYTRSATKVVLGEPAKKVEVVKAKDAYYLKK